MQQENWTSPSCSRNDRSEALDLRLDCNKQEAASTSENSTRNKTNRRRLQNGKGNKSIRTSVNIFRKHKLKYRYLLNRHLKPGSDSGNFGSSSMKGSSSTGTSEKMSTQGETTSSPSCTSASPSSGSGTSNSPQVFGPQVDIQTTADQQQMCMMLGHAVPLIVMMQGQLQSTTSNTNISYSNTMLFKCNVCNMFSNNLPDVLNHINGNHADIHYCFICNQFHSNKTEYEMHKDVCATACQAFQQIIDGHYHANRPRNTTRGGEREQALNLTVAEDVALRAAQIVHNKKSGKKKIKKLLKCTYCKKAFFGRFYLQRHLRSHTGEKACHCDICGKGFAEWRNLRNHMTRFHNGSESTSSREQRCKSVSPNGTSDSDQTNTRYVKAPIPQSVGPIISDYNTSHTAENTSQNIPKQERRISSESSTKHTTDQLTSSYQSCVADGSASQDTANTSTAQQSPVVQPQGFANTTATTATNTAANTASVARRDSGEVTEQAAANLMQKSMQWNVCRPSSSSSYNSVYTSGASMSSTSMSIASMSSTSMSSISSNCNFSSGSSTDPMNIYSHVQAKLEDSKYYKVSFLIYLLFIFV